jgi:hypothetical protein
MKVSRTYDAQSLAPSFYQSIDIFIFGTVTDEERNRRLVALWGGKSLPTSYHLDYDLETEEYSLIAAPLGSVPNDDSVRSAKLDITANMRNQLNSLGVQGKNVLVDITGISQPAIFYMLKLLYEDIHPAHLFVAYTEPFRYRAKSLPSSEDVFELTERFIGLRALPGFVRKPAEGKKSVVALLIGFEGKRAKYVCDTLEIESDDIRVVLGFPGFRPGWQYLAFGGNQSLFEQFQAHRFVWSAAANDPFEAYSALYDIRSNQIKSKINSELILAPVGTKPHSLGAAIFALHNTSDTRLVYDFPVKARRFRSEGYGITWIYNISWLMKETDVKNSSK